MGVLGLTFTIARLASGAMTVSDAVDIVAVRSMSILISKSGMPLERF